MNEHLSDIVSSFVWLIVFLGFFDQLKPCAELIQSMWGGKIRKLVRENEALRHEREQMRQDLFNLRLERCSTTVSVTDEQRELVQKLDEL